MGIIAFREWLKPNFSLRFDASRKIFIFSCCHSGWQELAKFQAILASKAIPLEAFK
jgi:hypothetical protein